MCQVNSSAVHVSILKALPIGLWVEVSVGPWTLASLGSIAGPDPSDQFCSVHPSGCVRLPWARGCTRRRHQMRHSGQGKGKRKLPLPVPSAGASCEASPSLGDLTCRTGAVVPAWQSCAAAPQVCSLIRKVVLEEQHIMREWTAGESFVYLVGRLNRALPRARPFLWHSHSFLASDPAVLKNPMYTPSPQQAAGRRDLLTLEKVSESKAVLYKHFLPL